MKLVAGSRRMLCSVVALLLVAATCTGEADITTASTSPVSPGHVNDSSIAPNQTSTTKAPATPANSTSQAPNTTRAAPTTNPTTKVAPEPPATSPQTPPTTKGCHPVVHREQLTLHLRLLKEPRKAQHQPERPPPAAPSPDVPHRNTLGRSIGTPDHYFNSSMSLPLQKASGFDLGSFVGGIVLTLGLLATLYFGCRLYNSRRGVRYRTIDEHEAII